MAGVSTKEIKNRIRSMESTRQITKAMQMVAASKLRRAQAQVTSSRPYFEILYAAIHEIAESNSDLSSPYLVDIGGKKAAHIVISGDRGLAGGYNSNVLKLAVSKMAGQESSVLPIGKKTVDYFKSKEVTMLSATYADAEEMSLGDCFTVAKDLCKRYLNGEFDRVCVTYTKFVSVLSQTPESLQLLPLVRRDDIPADTRKSDIMYEPSCEEVFETIIPEYLGGVLYGALCESRASEQAARQSAMDSATQNADEMIADLSLKFNRARQAAITQEITEIVAGQ